MKPGLKKSLNHTATAGPGYATFANGITVIQAPSAMPTLREVDMTGISDLGVVRLVECVFAVLDAILLERREVSGSVIVSADLYDRRFGEAEGVAYL